MFAEGLTDVLGVDEVVLLRVFGMVLVGHAAILVAVRGRPDVRRWTPCNLAAIAPYPLLLVGVVALGLVEGADAITLLLVDAAAVGAIALWQARVVRESTPA